jgi:hypothetical protein
MPVPQSTGDGRGQPRRIYRVRGYANGAALLRKSNRGPKRTQRRYVGNVAVGEVAEKMTSLIGYLHAGQERKPVVPISVKRQTGARRIGAVVIGYGDDVEVRLVLDVFEELCHRGVPVAPRVMAGVGV